MRKLFEIGELSLIERIRKRFIRKSKGIVVGIGDDAAVLRPQHKNLLLTTDMMVERVHFDLSFTAPYHLGFKLVSVNVSDIYAMGGTPQYLLLDIAMNKNTDELFIKRLFDGIDDAIKLYDAYLIGGDVSSSKKEMVLSASLTGYADMPIRRSGAKVGDKIYVTGNLGDSACGLEVLQRLASESRQMVKNFNFLRNGERAKRRRDEKKKFLILRFSDSPILRLKWQMAEPLLKRHLMPEARNPKSFARYTTAMIDISDGLFIDLSRLCNESKVGAKIYMKHIPISKQMKKVSSTLGLNSFKLATSGGEDYELLFTSHPNSELSHRSAHRRIRSHTGELAEESRGERVAEGDQTLNSELKITCIGEVTKKDRIVVDAKGRETELKIEGYQHFGIQR